MREFRFHRRATTLCGLFGRAGAWLLVFVFLGCHGPAAVAHQPGGPLVPSAAVAPGRAAPERTKAQERRVFRACVSGGAPLVGVPFVSSRGSFFFATADGYLHAYGAELSHLFSFTLDGTPSGAVSGQSGVLYVGTRSRNLYRITERGNLTRVVRTQAAPVTALVANQNGMMLFVGSDGYAYAVNGMGVAQYRVALPGRVVGDPVVTSDGRFWVASGRTLLRLDGAREPLSIPFDGDVERLSVFNNELFVNLGKRVVVVSEAARVLRTYAIAAQGQSLLGVAYLDEAGGLFLGGGKVAAGLPVQASAEAELIVLPAREGVYLWGPGRTGLLVTEGEASELPPLGAPVAAAVALPGQRGGVLVGLSDGAVCLLRPED